MSDTVDNRSEIVFLYDARDANPNGNPLSGADRPRIDPHTQQAIVTDVRLKRYIRDQLEQDGHGVYIRNVMEEGEQHTRKRLLRDRLQDLLDAWNNGEVSDEDLPGKVRETLLDNAADIRYFGATMSVDFDDDELDEAIPDHFTGPVQFSPGKTLHAVNENEEYDSLTSVIATQEGKEQGGFGLDDHRIQYGLIGFHGLVDEHAADDTSLAQEDVDRLDTLLWRSIKNQATSRSKKGQEPRLYLRVEYDGDSWHLGGLDQDISIDWENSKPEDELRTVRDLVLDVDPLVDRLKSHQERVDTVRLAASEVLELSSGDAVGGPKVLLSALQDALGADKVEYIDVYNEHQSTLPDEA